MNHGAAMRHGKARLCRAECPPHFLFVLPKRKRAGHGTKEKALRDELPGKAVNSPKAGAGRHALPTKFETLLPAALYLFLPELRSRTCGHRVQRGTKPNRRISTPARSALLRATRFGFCFILVPRPTPGGISKGESTKAPPGADKARCFRGNGTIGGPLGPGIVLP